MSKKANLQARAKEMAELAQVYGGRFAALSETQFQVRFESPGGSCGCLLDFTLPVDYPSKDVAKVRVVRIDGSQLTMDEARALTTRLRGDSRRLKGNPMCQALMEPIEAFLGECEAAKAAAVQQALEEDEAKAANPVDGAANGANDDDDDDDDEQEEEEEESSDDDTVPPEIQHTIEDCDYLASRGLTGIVPLKKRVHGLIKEHGRFWAESIPMHGAAMNGCLDTSLTFLVEEVKCFLDLKDPARGNNTALQHAVIWGRVEVVGYLLARGAKFHQKNDEGLTALAMARQRMDRILRGDPTLKGNGPEMEAEGRRLVTLLEGVTESEGWHQWARRHPMSPLVRVNNPEIHAGGQRAMLFVLRALAIASPTPRATLIPLNADGTTAADAEAAQARAEDLARRKAAEESIPVEDVMAGAGVQDLWPHLKLLPGITKLGDLRRVTRDHLARIEDIPPADRRRLWRFVSDEQARLTQGGQGESAAGAGAAAGDDDAETKNPDNNNNNNNNGGAKAKKKGGKAKKKGGGPVGAAAGASKKSVTESAEDAAALDDLSPEERRIVDNRARQAALATLFRPDMPAGAFGNVAEFLFYDATGRMNRSRVKGKYTSQRDPSDSRRPR